MAPVAQCNLRVVAQIPMPFVSHRAHRGRRDSHYFKLSISRFRLYMARCTEIPRYGCRGNRHGMTLECEDTEHRPHRHCLAPTAQCNLRVVAQIPMPFVSRSGRRGILLIAVRRKMPAHALRTSDFTFDFLLPTSDFLLPTPVSTNDKIALEDLFFIMGVCR